MSNWLDERFQCGAVCFLPPTSSVRVRRSETREFHKSPRGLTVIHKRSFKFLRTPYVSDDYYARA